MINKLKLGVVFFALALVANAGLLSETTTPITETVIWWDNPIGNNKFDFGSIVTRETLYQQLSTFSWLDWVDAPWPQEPWYSSQSYNRLENHKAVTVGTRRNGDEQGSFGTADSLFASQTLATIWSLGSTFFPLEDRLHIDIQKLKTLDSVLYTSLYTWDCRDLIQANLSGGCGGSNNWTRTSTYQGLGGTYISFDLFDSQLSNWQTGAIGTWLNTYYQAGFDAWDSQPFSPPTATPEPGTWALCAGGLGFVFLRKFRRG